MSLLDESYISYVNLDKRTERRAKMEQTLTRVGLRLVAERTRGMLPEEYHGPASRIKTMLSRPQKGAIGCHFSQVSIMERASDKGRHAFVMEDDLDICSDFLERMQIIDDFCAKHPWDIIWLGGTFHVGPPWWHKDNAKTGWRDAIQTDHPRMMRTYGAFCTYAYIVNHSSIPKVLKGIDRILPESMGIDWAMIQLQPDLFTYAFVPGCIKQYDHMSDIGMGMTTFSNFKKLGPYWWANLMSEFDPSVFDWKEAKRA